MTAISPLNRFVKVLLVFSLFLSLFVAGEVQAKPVETATTGVLVERGESVTLKNPLSVAIEADRINAVEVRGRGSRLHTEALRAETKGMGSSAIKVWDGASVVVSGESNLYTEGLAGFGLWALAEGRAVFEKDLSITTTGEIGGALVAMAGGHILINQGLNVAVQGANSRALHARSGAITVLGESDLSVFHETSKVLDAYGGSIRLDRVRRMKGAILVNSMKEHKGSHGHIDVTFLPGAQFDGAASVGEFLLDEDHDGAPTTEPDTLSRLNVILSDGALWNVEDLQEWKGDPQSSRVTSLLLDSGVVNLRGGGEAERKLTIGNLSGGGTFRMAGSLVDSTGSRLSITEKSSGEHVIDYRDHSARVVPGDFRPLLVVESQQGGQYSAKFKAGTFEFGEYLYSADILSGQKARLLGMDTDGNPQSWYVTPGRHEARLIGLNVTSQLAINAQGLPWLLERNQTTLQERMGELRRATTAQGGSAWLRFWGGRYDSSSTALNYGVNLQGFRANLKGAQVGYDWRHNMPGGSWAYGLALGLTKADLDMASKGDAASKGVNLKVYGTWLDQRGLYVDVVAGYGWYRGDFRSDSDGADSVDTQAWSLSAEVGKKFSLGTQGWFLEPQGQLTWTRFDGFDYRTDNSMRVQSADFDSFIGRLGLRLGFEGVNSFGPWSAYVKIGWEQEFQGDLDFWFNNSRLHHRGDWRGSWWTYGIGVSSQLSSSIRCWLDLQSGSDGPMRQQWHVTGGLRFEL